MKKLPLDHVVVTVPTLAVARARLTALGFTVQDDAHHPFGTGNCNVFFGNGTYFEPLAITDRDKEIAAHKDANRFVTRTDAYRFRHGHGPAMAAFTATSADAMHERFASEGLDAGPVIVFERQQTMADGSERTIGVRLAIAISERAPDLTLFACEHLSRDLLWQEERLQHANGAVGITRLFLVDENPADFQAYLQAVTGDRDMRATSSGLELDVPNALIAGMTPHGFGLMTGIDLPKEPRGLRMVAAEVTFADLDLFKERCHARGIAFSEQFGHVIVLADPGFPCILIGAPAKE